MSNNKKIGIAGLCLLGLVALYGLSCVAFGMYQVKPGHKGLVICQGKIESVEDEGIVLVKPWKRVENIPVHVQNEEEEGYVPTKGGLQCHLTTALVFRVQPDKIPDLIRAAGFNYQKEIVERNFNSAVRGVTGKFTPEELYSGSRELIEGTILAEVKQVLEPYGIICEQVLMKSIYLPDRIKQSIESKQAADQDAQRMEFVLKQAEKEALRKEIEANGIAKAQKIIKTDLDDNYIRYLWIEALKHHTGAIIYVPTGNDGLPFFKQVHAK